MMMEMMEAAELEKQKLIGSTVILFVSDNGGVSTSEGWPTSNAPLRAGKGWAYEGGVRVPMFAIIPNLTRPGSTCDQRAISTDIFPTLLGLMGYDRAGVTAMYGRALDVATEDPFTFNVRFNARLGAKPDFRRIDLGRIVTPKPDKVIAVQ